MHKSNKRAHSRRPKAAIRELIDTGNDKRFIRRDQGGKFDEVDEVDRSLRQDVKRQAKTKVKAGQGDKGDRPRSSGRRSNTKRKVSQAR